MRADPGTDAYIARSAAFAQPILRHLRDAVHAACPDAAEAIKWGMPCFMHRGRILAHMGAFKAHCAFGFGHGELVVTTGKDGEAMGQFGRITTLADLPSKRELMVLVKKAMALIDSGVKPPRAPKSGVRPPPQVPPELTALLAENPAARKTFAALSPSEQREYTEWIGQARREQTRTRRLAQTVAWLAEGKKRNWRYQRTGPS